MVESGSPSVDPSGFLREEHIHDCPSSWMLCDDDQGWQVPNPIDNKSHQVLCDEGRIGHVVVDAQLMESSCNLAHVWGCMPRPWVVDKGEKMMLQHTHAILAALVCSPELHGDLVHGQHWLHWQCHGCSFNIAFSL